MIDRLMDALIDSFAALGCEHLECAGHLLLWLLRVAAGPSLKLNPTKLSHTSSDLELKIISRESTLDSICPGVIRERV